MRAIAPLTTLALLVWITGCGDNQAQATEKVRERDAQLVEIARLQARLEQTPGDRATLVTLASRQWTVGRYDDAERSFERALQIADDAATKLDLVRLLYQRGHYLRAATLARLANLTNGDGTWLAGLLQLVDVSVRQGGVAGRTVEPDRRTGATVNSVGMNLLSITGGRFDRGDASGDDDQRPVRSIVLSPFMAGEHEVTVGQFALFVRETGYQRVLPTIQTSERLPDDHPVSGIAWVDAQAFTIWLSVREQAIYRLPTEAEWEFAARGPHGNRQPWGNESGQPQVHGNWGQTSRKDLQAATPPTRSVGSFPRDRSSFGLLDMAGNLQEWCIDEYDATYYAWSPERDPLGPVTETGLKVLRGGAWNHPGSTRFALVRSKANPSQAYTGYGFRVVREIQATRE